MGKNGPKFSHLLMVRAEGADLPPPPYGQPDCKKTVFSVVDDFPKGMVPKKKKTEKVWSFAKLGSRMVVKCQTSILEKYFFS